MNISKERNRRIVAICLCFVIITYAAISAAIKRGLNHDNYLVFTILILIPVFVAYILYKQILKLRIENKQDEDIRKQLNK